MSVKTANISQHLRDDCERKDGYFLVHVQPICSHSFYVFPHSFQIYRSFNSFHVVAFSTVLIPHLSDNLLSFSLFPSLLVLSSLFSSFCLSFFFLSFFLSLFIFFLSFYFFFLSFSFFLLPLSLTISLSLMNFLLI